MTDYGRVHSTIRPESVKVDDYSVWVNENITAVKDEYFDGFFFDQKRYTKDEYICFLCEQNQRLSDEVTHTQLALCELYEEML